MSFNKIYAIRDPDRVPGLSKSAVSRVLKGKADRYRTSFKNAETVMRVATEYHFYQKLFSLISDFYIIAVFQKLRISS